MEILHLVHAAHRLRIGKIKQRVKVKPCSEPSQPSCSSYLLKDGPLDVIDFKVNSNAREGCEDVGEEDDAVGLERVPRLEGDFNNQLGGL